MISNSSSRTGKRLIVLVVALLIAIIGVTVYNTVMPVSVSAMSVDILDVNVSDVMEDLEGTAVDNVPFDFSKYPANANGKLSVITFLEYGFTDKNAMGDYALFLYVYNPKKLNIVDSANNVISISTSFDSSGNALSYQNLGLNLLSSSSDKLFLKFKIAARQGKTVQDIFNLVKDSTERRYFIPSLDLISSGQVLAVAFPVKTKYSFVGSGTSLRCYRDDLTTIDLKVQHTTWRSGLVEKNTQKDISSAYFAVPNKYIEEYGKLQKIHAEWWEYQTKDMIVTTDYALDGTYKMIAGYRDIPSQFPAVDWLNYDMGYGLYDSKRVNDLYYFFTVPGGTSLRDYTLFGKDIEKFLLDNYGVADTVSNGVPMANTGGVEPPVYPYPPGWEPPVISGPSYVIDPSSLEFLFMDTVSEGRNRGYNNRTVDTDIDLINIASYESTHTMWDKIQDYGLIKALLASLMGKALSVEEFGADISNLSPIHAVTAEELALSPSELSKRLFIGEKDVAAFKDYCSKAGADTTVFLFRYGLTDYFSQDISYTKPLTLAMRRV